MIRGTTLNLRNPKSLIIVSLLLVLLLLAGLMVAAGIAGGRLDRAITIRSKALLEMKQLRSEARFLQQQIRQEEAKLARGDGESLVTIVEGLINRIDDKGNLAHLRPLESVTTDGLQLETLELKLEKQSLEQLLRILWEIENSPATPMRVASLRAQRRFESHALLDVTMNVTAYHK